MIWFILGAVILTLLVGGFVSFMIVQDWQALVFSLTVTAVLVAGVLMFSYGGAQMGWWEW
jgi:LPS O-antigen subunit length determinant protein (WzzB/FepE family)